MVGKGGRERGRETCNFDVVLSLTLVAMHGIFRIIFVTNVNVYIYQTNLIKNTTTLNG